MSPGDWLTTTTVSISSLSNETEQAGRGRFGFVVGLRNGLKRRLGRRSSRRESEESNEELTASRRSNLAVGLESEVRLCTAPVRPTSPLPTTLGVLDAFLADTILDSPRTPVAPNAAAD